MSGAEGRTEPSDRVVVVPLNARREKGWTPQDRADFARVRHVLRASGLAVETDEGVTDEGDPWFVVYRLEDGEVLVHVARIDGRYLVDGPALAKPEWGTDLRELVQRYASRQPLLLPLARAKTDRILLHPAVLLAALCATLVVLADGRAAASEIADGVYGVPLGMFSNTPRSGKGCWAGPAATAALPSVGGGERRGMALAEWGRAPAFAALLAGFGELAARSEGEAESCGPSLPAGVLEGGTAQLGVMRLDGVLGDGALVQRNRHRQPPSEVPGPAFEQTAADGCCLPISLGELALAVSNRPTASLSDPVDAASAAPAVPTRDSIASFAAPELPPTVEGGRDAAGTSRRSLPDRSGPEPVADGPRSTAGSSASPAESTAGSLVAQAVAEQVTPLERIAALLPNAVPARPEPFALSDAPLFMLANALRGAERRADDDVVLVALPETGSARLLAAVSEADLSPGTFFAAAGALAETGPDLPRFDASASATVKHFVASVSVLAAMTNSRDLVLFDAADVGRTGVTLRTVSWVMADGTVVSLLGAANDFPDPTLVLA